jgi:septum formation protein
MGELANWRVQLSESANSIRDSAFTNSPIHQLTHSPSCCFDPIIPPVHIVLASASPRRAELLTAAGFSFEVLPADVDERARPDEAAADYVVRLARDKSAQAWRTLAERQADSVGGRLDGCRVIGADTAVVADDVILGKPRDDDEARAMLLRLSGREHQVITGVSVRASRGELARLESTRVWFLPLMQDDLSWYISTGEWRDKAGAYAIQGLASRFIPRIEGSYSNVVGLPITLVLELLGGIEGL